MIDENCLASQLKLVPVSAKPVIVPWVVIVSSVETACVAALLWVELDLFCDKPAHYGSNGSNN